MAGRRRWGRALVAGALTAGLVLPWAPAQASAGGLRARQVNPFVGTGGRPPWFSGNTTPAAAWPFGMVQLGPDTTADPLTGAPSATASGYSVGDPLLRGFSATHLSGAGCRTFGDVPLLPWAGPPPDDPAAATVGLDHAREEAAPGWYRTTLGNGVRVRLVAGQRSGLMALTFPDGRRGRLLIQASGSLAGTERARVRFVGRSEVVVSAVSGGFCGSPGRYRVHVALRFDRPSVARGTWGGQPAGEGAAAGADVGGWVAFATGQERRLRVRIGVSFVDVAGARRNLASSSPGWSVPHSRAAAADVWSTELGRVRPRGGSASARERFDTALYHVLLHPTLLSDVDGRYPGFDGRIHRLPPGRFQYTAIPGWDAYRTHLPLLAWLRPDVASDVVRSLQRAAGQAGWLPRWPLVGSYTGVMNGDSAAPMVAAAYAFGARDFPLRPAVSMLVRNAEATDRSPGQGWFDPRPGGDAYLRLGYVPNVTPERGWPQPHGASTTLEYALDDFAVSRLATSAHRPAVADRFRRRSGSWRSLLDPDRGLLLPRDATGSFPGADYNPAACCDGYQEGNAVQYSWAVPQDVRGLLAALGSRDDVLARLVAFHGQLNAGAGTPYAWMGNQPSLLTPWLYLWLRRPALSQDVTQRVRAQLWTSDPDGIPGNDDLGSLSAWYVWSSLGLYPLVPGTSVVGIGRPAFPQVLVHPSEGDVMVVERHDAGRHVRGVWVDGAPRSRSWLLLGPGRRPSHVVVGTTDASSPTWGTAASDVPPSFGPP